MSKTTIGMWVCAAVAIAGAAGAQPSKDRGMPSRSASAGGSHRQSMTFHNPYTSGTVSADLAIPGRGRPVASVVLISGSNRREAAATDSLRAYLVNHGIAVMSLPPVPLTGATEEDNLNAIAAVHYLETRQDLRSAPAGIVGYGDGVRLAVIAAARGGAATFLALLGGAVVPDHLNSIPSTLTQAALPQDEAIQSLQNVRCPILAILGEYDREGTHRSVADNADTMRSALEKGRNRKVTVKVLSDADLFLADTGPGGDHLSQTAVPSPDVWKTAADWIGKEAQTIDTSAKSDIVEKANGKEGIPVYPKTYYGEFRWHPWYVWQPAIGDQRRPYGYWYW